MAKLLSEEGLFNVFWRGAKLYHLGVSLRDQSLQRQGAKDTRKVLDQLDAAGPDGREFLVPFLECHDVEVRVWAAQHLTELIPERALAVLDYIDEHEDGHASRTAFWAKQKLKWKDVPDET